MSVDPIPLSFKIIRLFGFKNHIITTTDHVTTNTQSSDLSCHIQSYSVMNGLRNFMKLKKIISRNAEKNHFDFISSIFSKYAEWDELVHTDQPLPGFLFSNKQLFWFTLIHKHCFKFPPGKLRSNDFVSNYI